MSAKIDRMSIMALSFLFAWALARQVDRALPIDYDNSSQYKKRIYCQRSRDCEKIDGRDCPRLCEQQAPLVIG